MKAVGLHPVFPPAHAGQGSLHPVFPRARAQQGMYESFYLRAVDPARPRGVWIRYTVHKRPGGEPRGSVWLTYFDAERPRPLVHKLTSAALAVPADGWIAVERENELAPGRARGSCEGARWSLRYAATESELRHLPRGWMYRAPLPRTKLTSPAPAAVFDGVLELPGSPAQAVELRGWQGMVGHNWGAQHAERWIWLHGVCFEEVPSGTRHAARPGARDPAPPLAAAWLDVAIGRVRVAGRTTPWVANGVLSLDGERHALGGIGARGLLVAETPWRCRLSLPGAGGLRIEAHVRVRESAVAGWRYADPNGGEHDVANCSIAALALTVNRPGLAACTLRTSHGAAYELGMREHDHGVRLAPFTDG